MQYAEMMPYQMDEELKRAPVAYIPWGTLRWNGPHLTLGGDAIKAAALCGLTGGGAFPPQYTAAMGP